MKLFPVVSVLLGAVASVLGQTIDIGVPTKGQVLHQGKNFTAQIVLPPSLASCIQVGIALAIAHCDKGVCPQPSQGLGDVLYAGPWTPTLHTPGGFYQNFSLQVPPTATTGRSIFTLTHLCLLGANPFPLLEYRNVTVKVEK